MAKKLSSKTVKKSKNINTTSSLDSTTSPLMNESTIAKDELKPVSPVRRLLPNNLIDELNRLSSKIDYLEKEIENLKTKI